VVCRNNVVEEIYQVSYDISKEKTRKREFRGLLTASKDTRCDNLFLIKDFHQEELVLEDKTIHIIPAYTWLIE
jgi:predicted AAA+ superfamily ATPase